VGRRILQFHLDVRRSALLGGDLGDLAFLLAPRAFVPRSREHALAEQPSHLLVLRRDALLRVDDEQHDVRAPHRLGDLVLDVAGEFWKGPPRSRRTAPHRDVYAEAARVGEFHLDLLDRVGSLVRRTRSTITETRSRVVPAEGSTIDTFRCAICQER